MLLRTGGWRAILSCLFIANLHKQVCLRRKVLAFMHCNTDVWKQYYVWINLREHRLCLLIAWSQGDAIQIWFLPFFWMTFSGKTHAEDIQTWHFCNWFCNFNQVICFTWPLDTRWKTTEKKSLVVRWKLIDWFHKLSNLKGTTMMVQVWLSFSRLMRRKQVQKVGSNWCASGVLLTFL